MDNPLPLYPSQEPDIADYLPVAIPRGVRNVFGGQPQGTTKQPDNPSVGQRIMNTASPTAAALGPATAPVTGTTSASAMPRTSLPGMEKYPQEVLGKFIAETSDPRPWIRNQVEHESQKNRQAHTPVDSQNARYRMGIGQRILGSLVNFGSGFSKNGLPPVNVGPGALNHRYYQDQQQREDDADASDSRLQSLQSALKVQDGMHDQLANPRSADTQSVDAQNVSSQGVNSQDVNSQDVNAETKAESTGGGLSPELAGRQADQPSPKEQLSLYEQMVRQSAQETDPAKTADLESGLRMMERIQQGRASGSIKPAPAATDGLTRVELQQFNDQAYGVNQRIAILEKAERTPETEAALRKLYQQRDAIASNIKSRRARVKAHR